MKKWVDNDDDDDVHHQWSATTAACLARTDLRALSARIRRPAGLHSSERVLSGHRGPRRPPAHSTARRAFTPLGSFVLKTKPKSSPFLLSLCPLSYTTCLCSCCAWRRRQRASPPASSMHQLATLCCCVRCARSRSTYSCCTQRACVTSRRPPSGAQCSPWPAHTSRSSTWRTRSRTASRRSSSPRSSIWSSKSTTAQVEQNNRDKQRRRRKLNRPRLLPRCVQPTDVCRLLALASHIPALRSISSAGVERWTAKMEANPCHRSSSSGWGDQVDHDARSHGLLLRHRSENQCLRTRRADYLTPPCRHALQLQRIGSFAVDAAAVDAAAAPTALSEHVVSIDLVETTTRSTTVASKSKHA